MRLKETEEYILQQMQNRLDPDLYYHGLHHTRDVVRVAMELAALENVTDRESIALLRTAALFHDSGFMNTYKGHEEEGCRIAREVLPGFKYTPEQVEVVCGMILATRIPQNPLTHLECILADADLDYLGREDFEEIAMTLFEELKARGVVSDIPAWNQIQVKFISAHFYWTKSARSRRDALKKRHLASLR